MFLDLSKRLLLFLVVTLVTACSSIGPQNINNDRGRYNDIVRETDQEQLLKNIVRLRYLETPSYLQVTSVTASYSLSKALTATNVASSSNSNAAPNNWSWASLGFTPNVTYSDSPTISYTPVTDPTFIASLQTPVPFADFILLSRGGLYDPRLLLTLLLDRVGELNNRVQTTSSGVYDAPDHEKFYRFTSLLIKLLDNKALSVEPVSFNQQFGLMLHFIQNNADALTLKKMLQVPLNTQNVIFMDRGEYLNLQYKQGVLEPENLALKPSNVVYVQLRSLNGIMSFLSHGVKVPEEDIKLHHTAEITYPDGQVYDWDPMMKGIMVIYSSNGEPRDDVLVKTYVNHHWFYIKSSDQDSKMTFSLLVRLITLRAITPGPSGPALTLPIGAN